MRFHECGRACFAQELETGRRRLRRLLEAWLRTRDGVRRARCDDILQRWSRNASKRDLPIDLRQAVSRTRLHVVDGLLIHSVHAAPSHIVARRRRGRRRIGPGAASDRQEAEREGQKRGEHEAHMPLYARAAEFVTVVRSIGDERTSTMSGNAHEVLAVGEDG
jgi:hypothetical protein